MAFVSQESLGQLLSGALESKWAAGRPRFAAFSDQRFWLAARAEIEELAREVVDGSILPTVGEAYDCDDYAFSLKAFASQSNRLQGREAGICLGIVWGRFAWLPGVQHAANWAVDDTGRLWWIEPQNGSVEPVHRCQGGIELMLV